MDLGRRGVPPSAVGAHPAAQRRQRATAAAGGPGGIAASAGHHDPHSQSAAVSQANARTHRAKDVRTGPHTCSEGGGTLATAASMLPLAIRPRGAREGGECAPVVGRSAPAGTAAARPLAAGAGRVPNDTASSGACGGTGGCCSGTGCMRPAVETARSSTSAAAGPRASPGMAVVAADGVVDQPRRRVPLAQGGWLLPTAGVHRAPEW